MTRFATALVVLFLADFASAEEKLDYNRDIRPILSNNCFRCHGPDEADRKGSAEGGLRLDVEEAAKADAIVPGKPEASELIRRILSTDADEQMPPKTSGKTLTAAQIDLLQSWVKQGAPYAKHWAFVAPVQAPLPKLKIEAGLTNPIDRFVQSRLEKEGLSPSPEADRYALVRRVYLDLIGLPPSPAEADAFVNDKSPDAYEKLVDKLLQSPKYGERWARRWLDLARYADTNGYEKDRARSIWPYRDWVIQAMNDDMPFDQFTIRQLAGDLLPNATQADRIATGFHRNTMLNEEGGIDPLEFRFYAMVDRVSTTGATWMGMTTGCAQCHTHKFDPLTHTEYYRLLALLNNADEPEMEVVTPEIVKRREEIAKQIEQLEKDLPSKFLPSEVNWTTPKEQKLKVASKATVEVAESDSWRFGGENPERDTYTLNFTSGAATFDRLQLETLIDGAIGPGRTPHGNFVLSEITITAKSPDQAAAMPIKLARAEADFSQVMFGVAGAIDGKPETGWAVDGQGRKDHQATFYFEKPFAAAKGTEWTIELAQNFGSQHTISRLRIKLGAPAPVSGDDAERRRQALDADFAQWQAQASPDAVNWKVLRPIEATSNEPILTILDDNSVFASGDTTKHDRYALKFRTDVKNITAIRLEGIPDPRLPRGGPGRVFYEGPPGDFALGDIKVEAQGQDTKLIDASQSFAEGPHIAKNALDADLQTVWGINGAQGKHVQAVFVFEKPIAAADELLVRLAFERHYSAAMGRVRISVTDDPRPMRGLNLPPSVAEVLLVSTEKRTADQQALLFKHYLSQAPQLAAARQEIESLRASMPKGPTTLVMQERAAGENRATHRHHRGEFLQPKEDVSPGVPVFLPKLTIDNEPPRLAFAKWLVSPQNPLTARVTVNRHWQAFFGRGIVRTLDDFGFQGDAPSHPELLDWLAVWFREQGWSLKKLHKLIVMSATYRQSSRVTQQHLERDAPNLLLARAPRFRLEGEIIRDSALQSAGLLSAKMNGPSVFPPQPASVTSEGTYGQLAWNTSQGEDRYRRSLYTFAKRTAPFAMLTTFDGPTGESCLVRREVSNTPLQSLTLLNDTVFVEAHQALGRRAAAVAGDDAAKAAWLFRECLTRPATNKELADLQSFVAKLNERLAMGKLKAAEIAGPGEGDANARAVWTLAARALLNTDEAVTRN